MKRYLSRLLALVLVAAIALVGCSASPNGLTGNYKEDTLSVISILKSAIDVPDADPARIPAQDNARQLINDFASRYRQNTNLTKLSSYTTMRTALNSLAGHYSSYPNRPIPQKLKDRVNQEFEQVAISLKRGT
ncbi:photosystem II protein Psb27 [Myxacorys almedinensis]|uniref:Photosystem II lipoprotein Psb27 n=1 Tax=Myxacorys almedinensis A TaxID=2690445 RepID=A0A8J7Z476_9CYAN|nr:photosystem II protein Psb27 [Myxacorys almedinensis]NDJ17576.1 photosystem II protein Psb27 [Myxacorys almedinensis A]